MARQRKVITDPKKRKLHEAKLARRRAAHADAKVMQRAIQAAGEGAESEADFEALVEAERGRLDRQLAMQKKGGSTSPKTITAARENLTAAFDLMGGVAALVIWGRRNPTEFYRLWARLIPKESMEISASLPLEALLAKLQSRDQVGMTVSEAAYSVGQDVLQQARLTVIEQDAAEPDAPNPYEDNDEEEIS